MPARDPARPSAPLRARLLAALRVPAGASVVLALASAGCRAQAPSPAPSDADLAASAASPPVVAADAPVDASPSPTAPPTASAAPSASVVAAAPLPPTTPPPVEREDPTACKTRITKCYPPNQPTSGGKVVQRALHFDKHGCLPKAETGGTCAAFFPTSEPRFEGGQCCYQGCPGPLVKCGRPLLRAGEAVVAALAASDAWGGVS